MSVDGPDRSGESGGSGGWGPSQRSLRVIGRGRAGGSLAIALDRAGWRVEPSLGRGDDLAAAARGVDLLVVATPDRVIAEVAAAVEPSPATVVAHLAGSLGIDVLATHPRRAALHPLVALPSADLGAVRLAAGAAFAVAGDPPSATDLVTDVVADLGGRWFAVADADRAAYHAAAVIASNHLVALLGQVERVAAAARVPLDVYLDLARATVGDVAALGPAAALTGPAARGDWATIAGHRAALAAIDPSELVAYDAMVAAARRLVDG